jgi:hypothetical protein
MNVLRFGPRHHCGRTSRHPRHVGADVQHRQLRGCRHTLHEPLEVRGNAQPAEPATDLSHLADLAKYGWLHQHPPELFEEAQSTSLEEWREGEERGGGGDGDLFHSDQMIRTVSAAVTSTRTSTRTGLTERICWTHRRRRTRRTAGQTSTVLPNFSQTAGRRLDDRVDEVGILRGGVERHELRNDDLVHAVSP